MYFQKAETKRPLMLRRNEVYEDSYILYKGGKEGIVSSALIDVEVYLKNHPEIKSKLIIDPNAPLEILKMKICEMVEKFPKLSGLSGLIVRELSIKTDKDLVNITSEDYISSIKTGDTIVFDLNLPEIWLEVEMLLQSDEKSLKIFFELKVQCEMTIENLRSILIKMGIKSWTKYIIDSVEENDDYDYYLFSNIMLSFYNGRDIKLEETVKNVFDFESKINCEIDFRNFNEILFNEVMAKYESKIDNNIFTFRVEKNRKRVVRKFITDFLHKFCNLNLDESMIAHYKNVIWKWNAETGNEKSRLSSLLQINSNCESRRESIMDDPLTTFGYCSLTFKCPEKRFEMGSIQNKLPKIYSQENLFLPNKSSIKFDSRYTQDFINLQNIDHLKVIEKFAQSFLRDIEFKNLDLTDTKNFKKLSPELSQFFNPNRRSSKLNSLTNDDFNSYLIKNKCSSYIKKRLNLIIVVLVLIFVFLISTS